MRQSQFFQQVKRTSSHTICSQRKRKWKKWMKKNKARQVKTCKRDLGKKPRASRWTLKIQKNQSRQKLGINWKDWEDKVFIRGLQRKILRTESCDYNKRRKRWLLFHRKPHWFLNHQFHWFHNQIATLFGKWVLASN